jgi:hypothetical protein
VNPGTGISALESGQHVKAENRVHIDAERASCIILPVIQ